MIRPLPNASPHKTSVSRGFIVFAVEKRGWLRQPCQQSTGRVAEWLCSGLQRFGPPFKLKFGVVTDRSFRGLQILLSGFDSRRRLHKNQRVTRKRDPFFWSGRKWLAAVPNCRHALAP